MAEEKRYYWLKLKETFFDDKQIKYLQTLPSGEKIIICYLKMQLKSLKANGVLKYDKILPSNEEELALILDEDINIVKLTLAALQKLKMIEIMQDGSFYMLAMQELIGKEGSSAERMRKLRDKQLLLNSKNNDKSSHCDGDVTDSASLRYGELEKEKELELDKELDIDKEKDKDKEKEYKEKNKPKTPYDLIPIYSPDKEIQELLNAFIEMRKKIRKPITVKGMELALKRLNKISFSDEERKEIISNSVESSWQTFYKPREKQKTTTENSIDEARQILDEMGVNYGQTKTD